MIRMLAATIIVLPLLLGGATTSEPNSAAIEDCRFSVDPSLITGAFLGCLQVEVGRELVHTRTWSDPDGDSARVELLDAPEGMAIYNKPQLNSYTLVWTPTTPRIVPVVLRITDQPRAGKPAHATGTLLIQVLAPQRRTAGGLCGGPAR
jgi:hypothetical protein